MKVKDLEYSNEEMESIIDSFIHSKRDREILKLCFIDGITHEKIAEYADLSSKQVSNIISKHSVTLLNHLKNRG